MLLNDGSTATIYPIWDGNQLPLELVASLCVEYNAEIEKGHTFPETHRLSLEAFEKMWFSGVSGIIVAGYNALLTIDDFDLLDASAFLGSFCISPCYPGRSSHICTANFLVKSKYRRRGIGMALAQCFMRWALHLGYDYALFNLIYDCNLGACKILDKLDFAVLSTLRGAGILKGFSYPVDAFIFGRSLIAKEPLIAKELRTEQPPSLAPQASETTSNIANSLNASVTAVQFGTQSTRKHSPEFQHLLHYLTHGRYPEGLSRSEHSRIRSKARYFEVLNGVLIYKRSGTEVVSDEAEQLQIAKTYHSEHHNGINKLVSLIMAKYYWHGVRNTSTRVISECDVCGNKPDKQLPPQAAPTSSQANEEGQILPPALNSDYSEFVNTPSTSYNTPGRLHSPQDPGGVVYLLPEDEDEEYIPSDEAYDMGLGGNHEEFLDEDDDLFKDDEDDEWVGGDPDDDDDDEHASDDEQLF